MADEILFEEAEGFLLTRLPTNLGVTNAKDLTRELVRYAHRNRPRGAILNAQGVKLMDPSDFLTLTRLSKTLQLMSVPTVICGIRPTIAASLTGLGSEIPRGDYAVDAHQALAKLRRMTPPGSPSELRTESASSRTPPSAPCLPE